jgi:hypothetical protein
MEDRFVRHGGSASTLHEVASSHHSYPKIAGYTLSNLYRRPLDSRPGQRAPRKVDVGRNGVSPERGGSAVKTFKGPAGPSQHFKCLGCMWNTVTMQCSVPPKRIKVLQLTALRLLRMSATSDDVNDIAVPTRDLAHFHDLATSCTRAIHLARRRLIYIQRTLSQAVGKRDGGVLQRYHR